MKTIDKLSCIGLLIFAGLLSLLVSSFGFGAIFAIEFQNPPPATALVPFLLLGLELPIFALSVGVSRRFYPGLWAIAIMHPLAMLLFGSPINGHGHFLRVVFRESATIPLLLIAALVQFCTTFYLLRLDKQLAKQPGNQV
jgi:hypothetical protein